MAKRVQTAVLNNLKVYKEFNTISQRINRTEVKLPINWCYFAAVCHSPGTCVPL